MPVIISNGNTTLNTASGFYNVEAYNLTCISTTSLTLSSTRTSQILTNFTPSACNIAGVALSIHNTAQTITRDVQVEMQEYKTCTMPTASPGVVTATTHGFADLTIVRFSTTGTLPTGVTAGTAYYVRYINANTFNLSTTPTGSLINFTGSPSGTHTVYTARQTKTLTPNEIFPTTTDRRGQYWVDFTFPSVYAVTATASKYRISVMSPTGAGTLYLSTSDGTNAAFAVWSDTAKTFTDNDTVLCKDVVTVDKTGIMGSVLGTGDTTTGISCIVFRSMTPTPDLVSKLVWENPAAAPYTLSIKGHLILCSHSGFRAGTSTDPIESANMGTLDFPATTVGSAISRIQTVRASGSYDHGRASFFIYGEIPSIVRTKLAADALTAQNKIITTEETGWVNGDKITIGKQDVIGQGEVSTYTVSSVTGTEITLTSNILTNKRIAGGTVIKHNGYGFKLTNSNAASYSPHSIPNPNSLIIKGCELYNSTFAIVGSSLYNVAEDDANTLGVLIEDTSNAASSSSVYSIVNTVLAHPKGTVIRRSHGHRLLPTYTTYAYYATLFKSGRITVDDCWSQSIYTAAVGSPGTYNFKLTCTNCIFENARSSIAFVVVLGINPIITDNYFWGNATPETIINSGGMAINAAVNATIARNTYERNLIGLSIAPAVSVGCIDTDSVFGPIANTTDIYIMNDALIDYKFVNATGITTINDDLLTTTLPGSRIKFVDYNGDLKHDRVINTFGFYQRCGDGLDDTTVHTSGTDKFSLRFEPISSTDNLDWSQIVPTGNIQNKTMTVAVWCKLNSSAFWGGTHQLPRLTVNYDNGTTAYCQAKQTTDWQHLFVTFNPTTTFGSITLTLSGRTDTTGADAYIYWDDFAVLYPAGYKLDMSGVDDWADALPVTPTIATVMGANDVWAVDRSTLTETGTIGGYINKKLLTVSKFLGLK